MIFLNEHNQVMLPFTTIDPSSVADLLASDPPNDAIAVRALPTMKTSSPKPIISLNLLDLKKIKTFCHFIYFYFILTKV